MSPSLCSTSDSAVAPALPQDWLISQRPVLIANEKLGQEHLTAAIRPTSCEPQIFSLVFRHDTPYCNGKSRDYINAHYHIKFRPAEFFKYPSGFAVVHEDAALQRYDDVAKLWGYNSPRYCDKNGPNSLVFEKRPSCDFIDIIKTAPDRLTRPFSALNKNAHENIMTVLYKGGWVQDPTDCKAAVEAYEVLRKVRFKEIADYLGNWDCESFAYFLNMHLGRLDGKQTEKQPLPKSRRYQAILSGV